MAKNNETVVAEAIEVAPVAVEVGAVPVPSEILAPAPKLGTNEKVLLGVAGLGAAAIAAWAVYGGAKLVKKYKAGEIKNPFKKAAKNEEVVESSEEE